MKAIVNTSKNQLEMRELSMPQPGPNQVRIHTGAVGICATDLQMVAGWDRTPFPAIPGHEWSGTVDATGDGVDKSLIGKLCVGENVLSDGKEIGFEHPGGYAEYFLTEAVNIYTLPFKFPFSTLALVEPLAVSIRGLNRLGSIKDGLILLFGDGPIGLILTLLLSRKGYNVVTVGGRQCRLDIAKEFGAHQTFNYHEFHNDLISELCSKTCRFFPTVIEASGSSNAMKTSLQLSEKEGKVLIIGDYGDACAEFPWNHVLWNEIELIGSNASAGAWTQAVKLIAEEKLPLNRLISHQLNSSDFKKGFEIMHNRDDNAIKVILNWRNDKG